MDGPKKSAAPDQGAATPSTAPGVNDDRHTKSITPADAQLQAPAGLNGRRTPEHLQYLRSQLRRFLELRGVQIAADGTMRCLNPEHPDQHPSAHCYEERVTCFVCNTSIDVFDACGFLDGIPNHRPTFIQRV